MRLAHKLVLWFSVVVIVVVANGLFTAGAITNILVENGISPHQTQAHVALRLSVLVNTAVVAIALSILAYGLYRSIVCPLRNVAQDISAMSVEGFSKELEESEREDEIGTLAQAFERTIRSLRIAMREAGIEPSDGSTSLRKGLRRLVKGRTSSSA